MTASLRLPVSSRDRCGISWLESRLSKWICYVRRRRKRRPSGDAIASGKVRVNGAA